MANQLLLIEDVDDLGRSGDIVKVKPGYARNFLIPQKKAVVPDKRTLRMQVKLQEERAKRAVVDKKDAELLAERIQGMVHTIEVKVDPEGHMYGSVGHTDIIQLFGNEGIILEKRNVVLPNPIKEVGVYNVSLRLKEGVMTAFTLKVESDIPMPVKAKEQKEPKQEAPEQPSE
jgi:large subunit ribosomal protein L9